MDMSPEMIALGTELASIAGKKSVEAIFDKIKTVKQKGNKDEIIGNLEEIINELIADKNSLIQISRAYEEKLITQKITDTEIDYITQSIIPLLEQLIKESNPAESQKMQAGINMIKPILSKETFNILQILGLMHGAFFPHLASTMSNPVNPYGKNASYSVSQNCKAPQ